MGVDIDLKWFKLQSVSGELNSPVQRMGGVNGGLSLMSNETAIDSASGNPIFFLERTGFEAYIVFPHSDKKKKAIFCANFWKKIFTW